jgi:glycosyltransferase involved in cell wall biosynthesis
MLNYEFPPLGGGGGRVSFSLAKGFEKQGYEVDVITSRYMGLPKLENIDGINIYRVIVLGREKEQTATFLSMFSFLFSGFLCGIRLCAKNRYDFINTHFVLPTGPLGFLLSKIFHLKNILSLHGGDIYDPSKKSSPHKHLYLRLLVRYLLNRSDYLVAQSTNTRKNAIKYYNPKKRIKIIPLPYEAFIFNPISRNQLDLKENMKYLISVGRLIKRKGFEYLISCLKLLDDNVALLIIGDGDEKAYLSDLAYKLHLKERVHFLGQISEEKKFQYLSNADIYVLSSLHEGFGIVLQEAMQVGLPLVSTNHGGQVDIVKHNVNGLLVERCHVQGLADGIEKLLNNKKLYQRMSQNNRSALDKYNTRTIIDNYLNLT